MPSSVQTDRLARGLLVLAVVLLFAPAIGFGWVYDDHAWLVDNSGLTGPGAWSRGFFNHLWAFAGGGARAIYWRPLFHTWAVVLRACFGTDPMGWHGVAIALHAAVAALAYSVTRRRLDPIPAALGVAWFALHPTRAESVAWVSGVNDALAALPILAVLLAERAGRRGIALVAFATALLIKEPAAVAACVPPLLVLQDRGLRAGLRPAWSAAWPFFAVFAGWFAVRASVLGGAGTSIEEVPLRQALATGVQLLGRYVSHAVAPGRLTLEGSVPLVSVPGLPELGWLALGVAGLVVLWRRAPECRAELLIGLAFLLPALRVGALQADARFQDRYLYQPMLWLISPVALTVIRVLPPRRALLGLGALVLLSALSLGTNLAPWKDDEALWSRALEQNPKSSKAWINLGTVLENRGDAAGAEAAYTSAGQAEPGRAYAWFRRGIVRRNDGRPQEARADFQRAISLRPEDPWFLYESARNERAAGEDVAARRLLKESLRLIDRGVLPAFGLRREDVVAALPAEGPLP